MPQVFAPASQFRQLTPKFPAAKSKVRRRAIALRKLDFSE
jgi:hypothetical protein